MRNWFSILLFALVGLAACRETGSPEEQLRRALASMESAAEERDVGDLMAHISPEYRDAHGRDADELSRYVRGYFIAHPSIHLLSRIENVEFPSADEARTKITVGMAGRQGDSWEFAAEIHQFDVVWTRERGDWKVRYAAWTRP